MHEVKTDFTTMISKFIKSMKVSNQKKKKKKKKISYQFALEFLPLV